MSGFIRIAKPPGANAKEVTRGSVRLQLGELYPVHGITPDNGSEFHGFKGIERLLGPRSSSPILITPGSAAVGG